MKEIHAYLNKDGTYRVDGVGYAMDSGALKDVAVRIPRAKINIEAMPEEEDKYELFTIEIKENNNDK